MAEKRITKINIDGEEYSVGDGGGEELEKLKKYVRSTPGSEEGTSAQFGLVDEYNYIQIDRKIENNENDEHNLSVTLNDEELLKIKDTVTEGSKNNIAYELKVNNLAIKSDTAHIEIGSGAGVADNSNAMAMGEDTVVVGQSSISLGQHNVVQGDNSFSLGENIELRGKNSLVIGQGSNEESFSIDANNSFVLGTDIKAQKNEEPYYDNIFAIGKGIKCTESNQTIIGKYNDSSEADKILVIGNGTAENNRSNLFSISNSGNININTQDFFQNSENGFYQIIADISEKEHYTSGKWNSLFLLKDDIGKKISYIDFKQSYYSNNHSTREMKVGISAPNEDYTNNLILGVDFSGKKTVELSDPNAWRSALVTDPSAWREALGITNPTPSYFRRTGSVNTVSWKGVTLNSFPAEGIWVIIFRTYASRANLGTTATTYLLQQIKINDEIIYEGSSNSSNKFNRYQSDNFFETAIVTHECTTSTKLECLMAKTAGTAQQIFYEITGFKIS